MYDSENTRMQAANFSEKFTGLQVVGNPGLFFTLSSDGTLKSYRSTGADMAFEETGDAAKVQQVIADNLYPAFRIIKEIAHIGRSYYFRTKGHYAFEFKDVNYDSGCKETCPYLRERADLVPVKVEKDVVLMTSHALYKQSDKFAKAIDLSLPMVPLLKRGGYDTIVTPFDTPKGDALLYVKDDKLVLRFPNGWEMATDKTSTDPLVDVLYDGYRMFTVRRSGGSHILREVVDSEEKKSGTAIKDWGYIDFVMLPVIFYGVPKRSPDINKDDYVTFGYPATQFAYLKEHGEVKPYGWGGIGKPPTPREDDVLPSYKLYLKEQPANTRSFDAQIPYYRTDDGIHFIGDQLTLISKDGEELIDYVHKHDCTKTLNLNDMNASDFERINLRGFILNYAGNRKRTLTLNDISA